jgi:hypothetical protein
VADAPEERSASRVADVVDRVAWDYDPEDHALSPLVSTRRYFRDFPWEPEEVMDPEPAGASGAEGVSGV